MGCVGGRETARLPGTLAGMRVISEKGSRFAGLRTVAAVPFPGAGWSTSTRSTKSDRKHRRQNPEGFANTTRGRPLRKQPAARSGVLRRDKKTTTSCRLSPARGPSWAGCMSAVRTRAPADVAALATFSAVPWTASRAVTDTASWADIGVTSVGRCELVTQKCSAGGLSTASPAWGWIWPRTMACNASVKVGGTPQHAQGVLRGESVQLQPRHKLILSPGVH